MKNELFEKFEVMRKNLPELGTIIDSFEGENIKLLVDKEVVFCNALIKVNNDDCSWKLVNENTGLKCLIFPQAQKNLELQFGNINKAVVNKLKVIAYNKKKTALLCENINE